MRWFFFAFTMISVARMLQGQQPPASSSPSNPGSAAKTGSAKTVAGPTPPAAKPTTAQVLKLLALLRVRDDLQATLDNLKQQMQREAEAAFREKIPNPSPAQLESLSGIVDQSFGEVSLDDLIHDLVPVYQRHLTRSDVEALVAFYGSPPGQKILNEQPAMIRESMQAAASNQQKRMELILAKMELRIQQLIEQEENKAQDKK
jgi:uncharacterized protein